MIQYCFALRDDHTMASPQATVINPMLLNPPAQLDHLHEDPLAVTLRFENPVHEKILDELQGLGATIKRLPSGKPVFVGPVVSIYIPKRHLQKLMSLPNLVRVESAFPTQWASPLYETARQVQADQLWWPAEGREGNMGEGITIADIESAWDIFHPDYFRPDAGYVSARDANGDGVIGAGDEVDLDGDLIFESKLSLFESGLEEGFQPYLDWLYVDENQDGKRNFRDRMLTRRPLPSASPFLSVMISTGTVSYRAERNWFDWAAQKLKRSSMEQPSTKGAKIYPVTHAMPFKKKSIGTRCLMVPVRRVSQWPVGRDCVVTPESLQPPTLFW